MKPREPRVVANVSMMATEVPPASARPLLRGVLHQGAFFVSVVVAPLVVFASEGAQKRFAAASFACAVALCFETSALYHRVTWSPRMRLVMRRLDHAGVYVLIAGTYTPVSLLVLHGAWRLTILIVVWTGAVAAIVLKFVWVAAPKWLAAVIGITLVGLPSLPCRSS